MKRALAIAAATLAIALPAAGLAQSPACPADAAKAIAAFAEPIADEAAALRLMACQGYLSRERAIATLADTDAPSAAALRAIAEALDDPAETVRLQAVLAVYRHKNAFSPILQTSLLIDSRPSRMSPWLLKADHTAALLDLLNITPAVELDAARKQRWDWLLTARPQVDSRFELADDGAAPTVVTPHVATRKRAVRTQCAYTGDETESQCNGYSEGETAIALRYQADAGLEDRYLAYAARIDQMVARYRGTVETEHQSAIPAYRPADWISSSDAAPERHQKKWAKALRSGKALDWSRALPQPVFPPPPPIYPPPPACCGDSFASLPDFPWPPPKPLRQFTIPSAKLGGPDATLNQVVSRLKGVMRGIHPDFETGLFSGPRDGFVLLTRMERIQSDGTPFPKANRFTLNGSPSAGLLYSITGLLGEQPGYFRTIAFVISPGAFDVTPAGGAIPAPTNGADMLPAPVGNQKLGSRRVTALVYAFQRRKGQPRRNWFDGAPSALSHLVKAGIAAGLGGLGP